MRAYLAALAFASGLMLLWGVVIALETGSGTQMLASVG